MPLVFEIFTFLQKESQLKGHNSVTNYLIAMEFCLLIENIMPYNFCSLSGIEKLLVFEIFAD